MQRKLGVVGAQHAAPGQAESLSHTCFMQRKCPICGKPTDSKQSADFPFCSERCKLLDLGNWASEKYRISEPVLEEPATQNPHPDKDSS